MVRRTTSRLDQLEEDHLGGIGPTRAELDDPRVPAGALGVAGGDLLEQLVDDEPILAQLREGATTGVEVAALCERDQLLDLRRHSLGLRLAGLDPLVLDQLAREIAHQGATVRAVAGELVALLAVAHFTTRLAAKDRARPGRP